MATTQTLRTTEAVRPAETYNDQIVRLFLLGAAVWGIVGMKVWQ